jgi:hypothetical protein
MMKLLQEITSENVDDDMALPKPTKLVIFRSILADLVICGPFICEFAYMGLRINLLYRTILYFMVILGLFICEFAICETYFTVPISHI